MKMPNKIISRIFLIGIAAALAGVAQNAQASDGRVEINQALALAGGVGGNPLDLPGFPVTISEGGSYLLTSDLVVADSLPGDPDAAGIVVTAAAGDLSLDLGGFEVKGPVTCAGTAPGIVCTSYLASGIQIDDPGGGQRATIVRNGKISGFAGGLSLPRAFGGCIIRDLIVARNQDYGIRRFGGGILDFPCLIVDNVVWENSGFAIIAGTYALVRDNVIYGNNGTGISGGNVLAAHGNTIQQNGAMGISMGDQGLASNNAIESNSWAGIQFDFFDAVVAGSLLIDNVLRDNGSGVSPPRPEIDASTCAPGYTNQVITNGAFGVTIRPCTSASHAMAPNLCDGSTTCP